MAQKWWVLRMDKAEARNILKQTGYIGNEVGVAFDVAIKSMDKLDKIEQIVEAYTTDNPREPMYDTEDYMNSIKEVLEHE